MNFHARTPLLWILLLAWLLVVMPAAAQEEPEPEPEAEPAAAEPAAMEDDGPPGRLLLEAEGWFAQPSGLEYFPATVTPPGDPLGTRLLEPQYGTRDEVRYRFGFHLPGDRGSLLGTYYGHLSEAELGRFRPGDFVFGELLAHPLYAGLGNDGFADAFEASTQTRTRDWRIGYHRTAFKSSGASGQWFIGWRRVAHLRRQDASYHALAPLLPPLIPPLGTTRPDLRPLPDVAASASRFEGRGPTAGLDVAFPLWNDRVHLEGGVSVAALRGKINSSYFSSNSLYLLDGTLVLGPPYDEFGQTFIDDVTGQEVPLATRISQVTSSVALRSESTSSASQVLEAQIGFRWKVRPRIDVFGGFRSTHYTDVGADLRPKNVTATLDAEGQLILNVQDLDERFRSATYEGLFAGVTFHIY